MITYFVTILFGLLTINSVHCTTEPELKFVQAIWRHGHRAPGELPYPKDKNGLNKWTRGWSQLSTVRKLIRCIRILERYLFFNLGLLSNITLAWNESTS